MVLRLWTELVGMTIWLICGFMQWQYDPVKETIPVVISCMVEDDGKLTIASQQQQQQLDNIIICNLLFH